ncbi:MAG TPA: ABC transporter permease [Candidatus Bathyarchaeia archaeon]
MADIIVPALQQAINLITSGDPEVYATVYRTIYVAGLGTFLACLWSIPIAVFLGLYNFRGKWFIKGIFNAFIGIPTVALGLLLFLLLSRQGELGFLNLLFTLNGIAIGEAILVTPIIVTFTANALSTADTQLKDLARTLGASGFRTNLTLIRETIWSIVLSVTASFNRCFGELGIASLVGGSILGETRVLTTSIAVWTNFGNFSLAMAYAIILMVIVIALAVTISLVERVKDERGEIRKFILWRGLFGG